MARRHFRQLLRFFEAAKAISTLDEDAVSAAGSDGERHSTYHRRIVAAGIVFGVMGAAGGLVLVIFGGKENAPRDVELKLLAPFVFAALSAIVGVATACVFAPQSFLTGRLGRKWMELIGTESVLVARLVCLMFTLMFVGLVTYMGWLARKEMLEGRHSHRTYKQTIQFASHPAPESDCNHLLA